MPKFRLTNDFSWPHAGMIEDGAGGFVESIGATVGALGNMGPALGSAGPTANFTEAFTEPGRLVLALYMLIGRLEIFPILLMFAAPLRTVRDRLS